MKQTYFDLQQENLNDSPEFKVNEKGELLFHELDLNAIIQEHGAPLRVTYLPRISQQIQKAKEMFNKAFEICDYKGKYTYCYCTKSSHFSFVLREALRNDIHIETSSAFDIPLIRKLHAEGRMAKDRFIVCNGFKRPEYLYQIKLLMEEGFQKVVPVLDNPREFEFYDQNIEQSFQIGLRIATEEMPNFDFYTSRLGINPGIIEQFYEDKIENHPYAKLKMLHFFINTGIKDHVYYWNELHKCLKLYVALKKKCPELDTLNIGGGFPFKTHLGFDYDYQDFVNKIIFYIKDICEQEEIDEPHIFTEFGSYTVAESSAIFYEVLDEKQQNDREYWYMINNSFMTTLPDCWGIDQRFIMLPLNHWFTPYKHVFLGGLTCDSLDFYNSEVHNNKIFLPDLEKEEPLYVGFFNVGAYQEAISGYGGTKHCLIPSPKHVIIDMDEKGEISTHTFAEEQNAESMLKILGYE